MATRAPAPKRLPTNPTEPAYSMPFSLVDLHDLAAGHVSREMQAHFQECLASLTETPAKWMVRTGRTPRPPDLGPLFAGLD